MFRKLLQSPITTIGIIIILGYIGFGFWGKYIKLNALKNETAVLKEKISELKSNEEINSQTSDEYIEREARIKLNYRDPDEKVVYVYRNNEVYGPQEQAISVPVLEQNIESNFRLWIDYLVGK